MERSKCSTKVRKWKQIDEKRRYKLEALLKAGHSKREIAKQLGYSVRTIQREVKRGLIKQRRSNRSYKKNEPEYIETEEYCADYAQMKHEQNGTAKGAQLKIGKDRALAEYIEKSIKENRWSPGAIAGRMRIEFPEDRRKRISVRTIYNYIDLGIILNVTNKDLLLRWKKKRPYCKIRRVALNNTGGKSIDERPEAANDRLEPGHAETDLIVGKAGTKGSILTIEDRLSRKIVYVKLKDKKQETVHKGMEEGIRRYGMTPKTITTDNGVEFLDSEGIKAASGCKEVYYTHPYCSWEKGSCENGNRMLRRFFPKGTDFGKITEEEIQAVEDWVNHYPRKIFGYMTANEMHEMYSKQVV